MLLTLAWTTLLMGIAGGPHCLAMCGAPCAAVCRPDEAHGRQWVVRMAVLQVGRMVGYAALGAMAAWAMQSLAWLSQQTGVLRPLWTLMHAAVLAWGLLLLLRARQPAWVDAAGRRAWESLQPLLKTRRGVFTTGVLWALMPCGLLYSALLVAALGGGMLGGAAAMALFALGGSVWLVAGPWLWRLLRVRGNAWHQGAGTRMAGLLLSGVAAWSLWADAMHRVPLWCMPS